MLPNINCRLLGLALIASLLPAGVALADRAEVRTARTDLNRLHAELQRELRSDPDLLEARSELISARRDMAALRRSVLHRLLDDPAYLARREQIEQLEAEIHSLHHRYRNGVVPQQRVAELASQALALRQEQSEMEMDLLHQEYELMLAREALFEATEVYRQVHSSVRASLMSDGRLEAAVQRLRQATDRHREQLRNRRNGDPDMQPHGRLIGATGV